MSYLITEYVHQFVSSHIKKGSICVDATAGNGNDTLFLCQKTGENGKVIALDIQPKAVENTKRYLESNNIGNAKVILDSHSNMGKYVQIESVDCILFNLGYLPGSDHGLSTKGSTTVEAIEQGLLCLKKDGVIGLCIYSGGDSGFEERDCILSYLKKLDNRKYLVLVTQYYNRPNNPPIPAFIIKLK